MICNVCRVSYQMHSSSALEDYVPNINMISIKTDAYIQWYNITGISLFGKK